jgi:acyl-CoA synthetase (AMP-forming)/AMP-acid ligase II
MSNVGRADLSSDGSKMTVCRCCSNGVRRVVRSTAISIAIERRGSPTPSCAAGAESCSREWRSWESVKGDRVALMLPNTPAYVMTSYALLRIGAVIVNVSPQSQGSELLHILRESEAVALFALDVFLPGLYKALDKSLIKYLYISSVQGLEKKLPVPERIPIPRYLESLFRTPQESTAATRIRRR